MNPFFVLGCQRSGTTLLRLILNSHEKIHCFDEEKSYKILSDSSLLHKTIENNSEKLIGFKTPALTEQINFPMMQDSVHNYQIQNKFQKSKLIFIYRNPFDVIASMKNYRQKNNKPWLENWILPTIEIWKKSKRFLEKYKAELVVTSKSSCNMVSLAALYWKVKNDVIFDCKSSRELCVINYERLCNNTKPSIKKILDFLEVNWQDDVLFFYKKEHDEVSELGITVGGVNAKLPIYTSSIDSYKHILTSEEINEIKKIVLGKQESLNLLA